MQNRAAPALLGCDTIVALAGAAADGVVLFGKNSDRPPGEPQAPVLIERATHAAGSTVRCQYVEIPQVRETARVLGSRPTWLWGFEMGLNEHGVAIGNETVFAHEAPAAIGLIGMDLVRLGLERADTAAAALQVIVDLIETHGQGGSGYRDMDWPYNNSFLIADPHEAWILEAAGRQWAARRATETDSISNHVSIATDWERVGARTVARARECGLETAEPFDFARAYRDTSLVPPVLSSGRLRRSRQLLAEDRGRHTLASLRRVLADHDAHGTCFARGATPDQEQFYTVCMHEGPSRTAMGMVAALEPASALPRTAWLAFGRPCTSVWFPLLVAGTLPDALVRAGFEGPPGGEGLWWMFEQLAARAEDAPAQRERITAALSELGAELGAAHQQRLRDLAGVSAAQVDTLATESARQIAARLELVARGLLQDPPA
ncbi:C69 family dipeptidase [Candidatus Binatia bacterium]|nr:C69 family dipeptidase [Candidatus Binatia bacterium]